MFSIDRHINHRHVTLPTTLKKKERKKCVCVCVSLSNYSPEMETPVEDHVAHMKGTGKVGNKQYIRQKQPEKLNDTWMVGVLPFLCEYSTNLLVLNSERSVFQPTGLPCENCAFRPELKTSLVMWPLPPAPLLRQTVDRWPTLSNSIESYYTPWSHVPFLNHKAKWWKKKKTFCFIFVSTPKTTQRKSTILF